MLYLTLTFLSDIPGFPEEKHNLGLVESSISAVEGFDKVILPQESIPISASDDLENGVILQDSNPVTYVNHILGIVCLYLFVIKLPSLDIHSSHEEKSNRGLIGSSTSRLEKDLLSQTSAPATSLNSSLGTS